MEAKIDRQTSSDMELIDAFLDGNLVAYDLLIDRYKDKIFRMILSLVGDAHDAEELAQDIFVIIFTKLQTFKRTAMFSTWLYAIVQNRVNNYRIRKKIRQSLSLDWLMEESGFDPSDQKESFDASLEDKERIMLLNKSLDKLPFKWRQVLILRELNDLSYEEVAAVLKCSIGTVKSRLFRAKEKLKAIIESSPHSKEQLWMSVPLQQGGAL